MLGWQEEALGGWEQERSIECIRSEERVLLDIPIGNFPFWSYRIRRTQKPRRQNVNVESAPFQKYQTEDPLKTPKIDTTSPDLAVIKASRFLSASDIVEERHHPPLAEWISRPHIKQHQYYISIHNNCVAEKRCKEVLFRLVERNNTWEIVLSELVNKFIPDCFLRLEGGCTCIYVLFTA